jgi:LacI family transcriptional regulator
MNNVHISLKDIARALGLSISTVSRALNNKGEINEETRRSVLELAERLRYRPNPLATGLLKKKTGTIGVILPEIDNYHFATILRGMDAAATQYGYQLLASFSSESREKELQAIGRFMLSRTEGILACPACGLVDFSHYMDLINGGVPLVICNRESPELETYTVVTDNYKASLELTRSLIGQGRRNICLIANLEPLSEGKQRYEGYLQALQEHHIAVRNDWVIHGNMNVSTTAEAVKNLLGKNPRPDAILCNSDSVAMVVMKMLRKARIRVPQEIAVTGFSEEPFSAFLEPTLTTVALPAYLLGMRSMELMIGMLLKKMEINRPEKIILESGIIFRDSTGS